MKTTYLTAAVAIAAAMFGSAASADPLDYYKTIAMAGQGSQNGSDAFVGSTAAAEPHDYYKMIANRTAESTKSREQVKAELAAGASVQSRDYYDMIAHRNGAPA